jgi:hypothetical protein
MWLVVKILASLLLLHLIFRKKGITIIPKRNKPVPFASKMDRKQIVVADSNEALDEQDIEYWSHATAKEKLQTITYLRECFYGQEATTGRLQRFHTILELK